MPAAVAVPVVTVAPPADWARTLERIAASVVTIQIDQTRSFDTERNTSAQATGFVIDAERGLILTNRHVVTPGPVIAEATFLNREEVELRAVYRDPVHDFGIYRYDPAKLHFIKPEALPLVPEAAQVGREIRVVGNDAGEQLSILAGTLARLDREAPEYGLGRYNDFNTFYIQAASSTSGGSSGSPVIDVQGRVVALNAGGASGSATSFYLPLGRVQRAVRLIQQGKPVTRGTIGAEFHYRPYDELRRLGLQGATEAAVRAAQPANTGMLVVERVLPGSASDTVLAPGDVLLRLNGTLVSGFEPLEAVLDEAVGGKVRLELERGGKPFSVQLTVADLHAITPASYLEFGDAIVHTLSYQEARHFHRPASGVFVAASGYSLDAAGVPRGAVITEVNSKAVTNLAEFEAATAALADGERFAVRYVTLDDPNRGELRSVHMDRRWFPTRHCARNDATGYWDCISPETSQTAPAPTGGVTQPTVTDDPVARMLAPSLVGLTFDMPYPLSGRERAQLSRHRADRRRRARPGDHRPQHRAGLDRRRAADLRGHAGDSRQGDLRAPAAQPRGGAVRPGAAQGHAGALPRGWPRRRCALARTSWSWGSMAAARSSRAIPRSLKSTRCCCRCRARWRSATVASRWPRW